MIGKEHCKEQRYRFHPQGFVSSTYPGVQFKCARNYHSTQSNSQFKIMTSAPALTNKGSHGGSRSVLCWQDKLALLDENVMLEFAQQANCGGDCNCFDKIRELDETTVVQVIRELRTERMAGAMVKILRQTCPISMMPSLWRFLFFFNS